MSSLSGQRVWWRSRLWSTDCLTDLDWLIDFRVLLPICHKQGELVGRSKFCQHQAKYKRGKNETSAEKSFATAILRTLWIAENKEIEHDNHKMLCFIVISMNLRRHGLVVTFESNPLSSGPIRGHCVVSLGKTLYSVSPSVHVYKRVPANFKCT